MKKKARSRIITFWKTEGEKIVFLSFVPNKKYTGSYIRILAPSTFFFRRSFLIHYRFPRKHETGSRWLRSINYIFVPYLHDRGPPYLSPLSIPYSLEITLIKKFWYTVESIRFLYHWKGWEEGGYGQRTNLYESNKTMFRNKKERARVSLLEGMKRIFQRILGIRSKDPGILWSKMLFITKFWESFWKSSSNTMERYIVCVMQTDRSSPSIRGKVERSDNKRRFSKSTSSLHDKTPHRRKINQIEGKVPRWKVASFQLGEAHSKYRPGLYRKRGNYICNIIIAVDFFGNLFPDIQRTLGNSVETLRGKRNLKAESSGLRRN